MRWKMKETSSIPKTFPKFLWYFSKRFNFCLLGFIMIAVFWAINLSLTPYAMKLIIDTVSTTPITESLFMALAFPILFYFGLNFFNGAVFFFYDWLMIRTFPNMEYAITHDMFDYVEKHSYSYFQHSLAGSIGNKINDMAKNTTLVINHLIDHFLARTLGLLIGIATMYFVNPYFAYVLAIWSFIFMGASIILSKKAQNYAEIYSEARSTLVGKVVDSIGNILTVKLFARERHEKGYLKASLEDAASKDRSLMWYLLKVKAFYTVTIIFLVGAMLALLVHERSKDTVTVGDFALILTLTMFLIDEVFFIANQLVPFSGHVGACKQALSIISPKHEIVDPMNASPLKITKGQIEFDKVHFQYSNGENVFSDKSITIEPGQRVGLVGFSGSGKSTFVNLILRFFDIDSGRILIDGQDIKSVSQESLRSQIAMIPQDPALFHRSIAENIGYGCPHASLDAIIDSSKKAHCHEFIEKLPDGYHSLAGERGVKLSGGQRQRIAIARAILKNAPILILDEATSALDSVTENHIQESLAHLMEGKTSIVIAHRLSTLFYMDRILVFNNGQVIEDGSHHELLELEGHYANLWSMQAGGFLEEA